MSDTSYRMRVLSAIAISFVVLGHINFTGSMEFTMTEPLTFQGWFPCYSFHLPLFLFITGYFFRDLPEDGAAFRALVRFVGKKACAFQEKWFGDVQQFMLEFIDAWKKS